MKKVYIAGPYTLGDTALNVRRAILAADEVWAAGFLPYVPHLDHLWHLVSPKPISTWYAMDIGWLRVCDAVLRLQGESEGADIE